VALGLIEECGADARTAARAAAGSGGDAAAALRQRQTQRWRTHHHRQQQQVRAHHGVHISLGRGRAGGGMRAEPEALAQRSKRRWVGQKAPVRLGGCGASLARAP
jgi:hypothetical protein